jgi:tight adherence protein B
MFPRAAAAAAEGGDVANVLATDPATSGLGAAWTLAEQAGAPLVAVVERVAADLDAAEEQRRAVAVALAGPRSSAAVLAGLPALGLLLGAAMGGRPLAFLAGSPAGVAVGLAGLLLDLVGLWWMRRILRWASR